MVAVSTLNSSWDDHWMSKSTISLVKATHFVLSALAPLGSHRQRPCTHHSIRLVISCLTVSFADLNSTSEGRNNSQCGIKAPSPTLTGCHSESMRYFQKSPLSGERKSI